MKMYAVRVNVDRGTRETVLVKAENHKEAKWKAYYLFQKKYPDKELDAKYANVDEITEDFTKTPNPSVR